MDYTSRERNNFNLIRMVAAYMVIYAHSFAMQGEGTEIVTRITGQTHLGQMAVFIFTFLSGIFITKSIINIQNTKEFLKRRVLRLYPELLLCLMVILVLGACFTTYTQYDYWINPQVRKYFIANTLEIANEHFLPGVFQNHPNQGMNGVLWYITFQLRIYLLYALLKSLNIFEEIKKANIILLILLIWIIAKAETVPFLGGDIALWGNADFPQYTITFLIASLFYINIREYQLNWGHLLLMAAIMFIFRQKAIATWVWAFGFIVFALYLGTNNVVNKIKVPVDFSYGIFLYGWPMGQLVNEFFPEISPYLATIITIVITTGAAILSYHFSNWISGIFIKKETRI